MARHESPVVPFVQARNVGGSQKPTAISIGLSMTTSVKGAALGIAQAQHQTRVPSVSYHYILDEEQTFRCIPDDVAAHGNYHRAISILICAQPHEIEALWEDATAKRVLHRAADLVADMVLVHRVRPRYIIGEEEERWRNHRWHRRGGILVHVPGTWPYDSFLGDVRAQVGIKQKT